MNAIFSSGFLLGAGVARDDYDDLCFGYLISKVCAIFNSLGKT